MGAERANILIMELTTDIIKQLRDATGVSVMQCKKALEDAGGDLAKAEVILRKRSAEAAEKKESRELGAGAVGSYMHEGTIGAMVLLACETDFVARNPEFAVLARDLAMQVAATDPKYVGSDEIPTDAMQAATSVFAVEVADKPEAMRAKILAAKLTSYFSDKVLLDQHFIKDETKTVSDLINVATQKFGERIQVSRFVRFSAR